MCHYYTVHCICTACFNHARSIMSVLSNAVTVLQWNYNAIFTTVIIKYSPIWWWVLIYVDRILERFHYLDMQLTMWISIQSANRFCWCYNAFINIHGAVLNMKKKWHHESQSKHCCSFQATEAPWGTICNLINMISFFYAVLSTILIWAQIAWMIKKCEYH